MSQQPIVASYCTTFLKPEMRHIYRQVTGLKRYQTFVMTRERAQEEQFPFADVEVLPKARKNFVKRFFIKYIQRLPPVHYRGELQVIIKLLERRPADLLHVYFGHTGVHLLPFIKEWDHPCVVSFHGMDIQPRPGQPGYDQQMRELLRTVPLVLARSRSLMDRLEQLGCPPRKLRLNRTGIPLDSYPRVRRGSPKDGAWRLVQACRLIEKKGLRTTLRAFAQIRAEYPNAQLILAGDGPLAADLQKLAAELGLGAAVEMRGFLSQVDLGELYGTTHLFLHPSEQTSDKNQEGVPNSMLEAMATGLPVVATQHGGIPEAVRHGVDGLLVPERDSESLAGAIRELLADPSRLATMGEAASNSVQATFSQTESVARLEEFYDEARSLAGVKKQ